MKNKNKYLFLLLTLVFIITIGMSFVSAANNTTTVVKENQTANAVNTQQFAKNETTVNTVDNNKTIKNTESITNKTNTLESTNTQSTNQTKTLKTDIQSITNSITLNTTVKNTTVNIVYDTGSETAITKNITVVNGKPDVTKLGTDYAYVDDSGTYTILSSEILRVMKLDSQCQYLYGYTPKYTFFRAIGSNTKYVISREKWNVIARALNSYHVKQGYYAVNPPYAITVNLTGKIRYYPVYYDAQEWINGHQYTCGPTAMSMISQALNTYASERRLSGIYGTTASDGTDESKIISNSPQVHMKLTNILDNKNSVKNALLAGKMIFWHISGHYMCVIGYNSQTDKFLCLNPSGPSHNINAVQWATWTQMMNTDRSLKENGFMQVTSYWSLTSTETTHLKYYYYNMGGKYTVPSNAEYPNNGDDNTVKVTVNEPSTKITTTNQTTLLIKTSVSDATGQLAKSGKVVIKLNGNTIATPSIINGIASLNYTLPAYTANTITIDATYLNSNNVISSKSVTNTFNKYTAGKTYTNSTKIDKLEGITVSNIVTTADDTVTLTAHIQDSLGRAVQSGSVVFKLNGKTLKQNGVSIKVNVVNGVAQLKYTIPKYSAKNYVLTAVFGNSTTRLENSAVLTIQKKAIKITNVKTLVANGIATITGKIIDNKNNVIEGYSKATVKINGKTLVNKAQISNGVINIKVNMSSFKVGTYKLTIISGENSFYKSDLYNGTIIKT